MTANAGERIADRVRSSQALKRDEFETAGNLFISSGGRGDPDQNCRDILRAMSEAAERHRARRTPQNSKRLLLRPAGRRWRLTVTVDGHDAQTGDLYRVTTESPLADVHLAAAARALRVVHTRTTAPCWRQLGDTWTADLE